MDDTAIEGNVHVTGPVPLQFAAGVTDTNVAGPMKLSVIVTLLTDGPPFVTFTV